MLVLVHNYLTEWSMSDPFLPVFLRYRSQFYLIIFVCQSYSEFIISNIPVTLRKYHQLIIYWYSKVTVKCSRFFPPKIVLKSEPYN